jgi:hypothetical protein
LGCGHHGCDGSTSPPELLGIHTNMAGAVPPDVSKAIASGGPAPSGLSDEERRTFEKVKDFFAKGVYYASEMATRPQTLYGIADSPVGLAAWLIDHGDGDAQPAAAITAAMRRPTSGKPQDQLTRDDVWRATRVGIEPSAPVDNPCHTDSKKLQNR